MKGDKEMNKRVNAINEWLNKEILYGGEFVRRGDVIKDLQRILKTRGVPEPEASRMIDMYLIGANLRNNLPNPAEKGWVEIED